MPDYPPHTFVDDNGDKVETVTAEQHALFYPEHIVVVRAHDSTILPTGHRLLMMSCSSCQWWNEEGYQ